jgi:L-fucose isomerase-like protein
MDTIEIIVLASERHDAKQTSALKDELLSAIRTDVPFSLEEVDKPSVDGFSVVLVLTGGVERDVLRLVAQLPSPILLVAHPSQNSLPAALEILARIRHDGGEGRILFGTPSEIARDLAEELAIARAWKTLRFSRIGLIGEPSEKLVASDLDRAFVKGRLSIELISIRFEELLAKIAAAEGTKKSVSVFRKGAKTVDGPDAGAMEGAIRIYDGLRDLVDEHRLSACSLRCFDLLDRFENTGCYALSRLNDEHIPAGCEGDLQTLFSLYIAFLLFDRVAFMGNVAAVGTEERTVTVAHCTCPLSMAAQYGIRTHFESGLGVGIAGEIPTGPCTLFRLGGERLDHLFIREGQMVEHDHREDLCRTQVRMEVDGPVDELLDAPLGNHHVLLSGHHRKTIERFFRRYLAA